jgi:hypothetical protein
VTSSKGGIAAAELQRQLGLGSYQTAWTWLHKIRKAMVRPGRAPLGGRVEADETYLGAAKPGRPGRGAAGKALVAGAVEARRGKARGRRLGRLRLARLPDAGAKSLKDFLGAAVARPAAVATDGWSGYAGLAAAGYDHEPVSLSTSWGDAVLRLPAIHLVPRVKPEGMLWPRQALAAGHPPRRGEREAPPGRPWPRAGEAGPGARRVCLPLQPPHRQAHQPRLRPPHRARCADQANHLPRPRRDSSLTVLERQ